MTSLPDNRFVGGLLDAHLTPISEAIHWKNASWSATEKQWAPAPMQEFRTTEFRIKERAAAERVKPLCIFGGLLLNHYGHFLLESLGRLWAYHDFRSFDPWLVFYAPWGQPDIFSSTNYLGQFFARFELPAERVLVVDHPLILESLLVPACQFNDTTELLRRPGPDFMSFLRRARPPAKLSRAVRGSSKIYVSRSRLKGLRGSVIGEKSFETWLQAEGFRVIHPERLRLEEQLAIFSQAEYLVFLEGSAMHTCILLPDLRAKIAVIARRRSDWDDALILDHFRGFGIAPLWIDEIQKQYRFGLPSWSSLSLVNWEQVSIRLAEQGFISRPYRGWEEDLRDADLEQRALSAFVQEARRDPAFKNEP